jgi:hypothetical protein
MLTSAPKLPGNGIARPPDPQHIHRDQASAARFGSAWLRREAPVVEDRHAGLPAAFVALPAVSQQAVDGLFQVFRQLLSEFRFEGLKASEAMANA